MPKRQDTPADVYREELRALEAREDILQMRFECVNKEIVKVRVKLEEAENSE